jgi:hypothetical protein
MPTRTKPDNNSAAGFRVDDNDHRIVFGLLLPGKSLLRVPSGMRENMEIPMAALSSQQKTRIYFNRDLLDD